MLPLILRETSVIDLIWRALKWHFKYLVTGTPSPLACSCFVTNKCNFRCSFCNLWRKPGITTLSLAQAKNIIDGLNDIGCYYLSISGGEPFLVDHLFDILGHAKKSNIKYIHVVTNGYLLNADNARRLNDIGINDIAISIDGVKERHDKQRGVAGAYDRALEAVEHMKRYAPGVKVVLNAILFPDEPFEVFHVAELAKRYDVFIKVQPLNQLRAFDIHNCANAVIQKINPADLRLVIDRLKKDRRVVNSRIFLDNIYNFFCRREKLIFRSARCYFGYHHIEILETGMLFPCVEGMEWKNGRTFSGGLAELLASEEYRKDVERLKTCKGCQRVYLICYYEPRIKFPINNFIQSCMGAI